MVSAYALYYRETEPIIKRNAPDSTEVQINATIEKMWAVLSPEYKLVYLKEHNQTMYVTNPKAIETIAIEKSGENAARINENSQHTDTPHQPLSADNQTHRAPEPSSTTKQIIPNAINNSDSINVNINGSNTNLMINLKEIMVINDC